VRFLRHNGSSLFFLVLFVVVLALAKARGLKLPRSAGAYSTVTVLARLRGWSTLRPRRRAIR
jgi:hypothetical protein